MGGLMSGGMVLNLAQTSIIELEEIRVALAGIMDLSRGILQVSDLWASAV